MYLKRDDLNLISPETFHTAEQIKRAPTLQHYIEQVLVKP